MVQVIWELLLNRLLKEIPKVNTGLKVLLMTTRRSRVRKLDGVPVYSRQILTKEFIEKEEIKAFIIAINNIAPAKKKEVIESVIQLGCEILDTPSFDTWLNGHFEVKQP